MKGFLLDNELQAFFIIKKENFYCSFNVEFSNGMKCKFHIIHAVNVLFMWYITYIMLMDAVVTSFHGLVFLCSHLNYGKCMLLIFFSVITSTPNPSGWTMTRAAIWSVTCMTSVTFSLTLLLGDMTSIMPGHHLQSKHKNWYSPLTH